MLTIWDNTRKISRLAYFHFWVGFLFAIRQSLFKRFFDGGKFGVSALAEMESLTVGNRLSARLGSLKADLSSARRQPSAERTFTE